MVQFYAFPAPREDLFRSLSMFDIERSEALPFSDFSCAGVKYQEGMAISDVIRKVKKKWLEEFEKINTSGSQFQKDTIGSSEELIEKAAKSCLHGYIVLDDTAKMLLQLKKSHNLINCDMSGRGLRTYKRFAYLNMLLCMRAEGTYVDILTDGKEVWLTHEDESLRKVANMISKTHCLIHRPKHEEPQEEVQEETPQDEMPILPAESKRRTA